MHLLGGSSPNLETIEALLSHTQEHNQHHLDELHTLVHQLEDLEQAEAAAALDRAAAYSVQANAEVDHARGLLHTVLNKA